MLILLVITVNAEDLDDVAAVEETYKRGIDDGIIFHTPTRRAAESYLLSKGRKLPESVR